MRALGKLLPMAVVVIFIPAGSAQEKQSMNKQKILGAWRVVRVIPEHKESVGETVEFRKDGKLVVSSKDMKVKIEGIYRVDGDTLTLNIMGAETHKIKRLTDTDMIWETKKEKAEGATTIEFKRVR